MRQLIQLCFMVLISSTTYNVVAADAAGNLIALLNPIKNISADFEQRSLDEKNTLLQTQTGTFTVDSGGKFIWQIAPPFDQNIVSDGLSIKIYDPDLEQLTIKAVSKQESMIPLLLFSGDAQKIISQYEVTRLENEFILKPKEQGGLFAELLIQFKNKLPSQLEIRDNLQQTIKVTFKTVVVNQVIPPNRFELLVPDGTDIIDER